MSDYLFTSHSITLRIDHYLLFTFYFLSFTPTGLAQLEWENRAIIHYFDGSIFIGTIVEEDPLQVIMIAATSDTLHLNKASIKKIFRNSTNVLIHNGGKFHFKKGLFWAISTTLGAAENGNASFQQNFVIGKRFNKKWSAGLGTGLHFNEASFNGIWTTSDFIPFYAYGRYYVTHKRARIFAASKLGFGFASEIAWSDAETGGLLFQPEVGIHFASRKNARFVLSIGQYIQHTKGEDIFFDQFGNPVNSRFSLWLNRTVFKAGIEFK